MGLLEQRAVKAFREYVYPRLEKEIQRCAGFDVPIEVDWHALAERGTAHLYPGHFTNVYFLPLIYALGQITIDDLGCDALRQKLTRIVVTNSSGNFQSTGMAMFDDGVLTIDHVPHSNVNDIGPRVLALVQLLEANL
jgi:hypothetical protein